jgi:MSHA pilin protein MshB
VNYDGQEFWLTESDGTATSTYRDGYPYETREGSANGGQGTPTIDVASCIRLINGLLQNPPAVTDDATDTQARFLVTATSTTVCRFTQVGGPGHFFEYDITAGSVQVNLQ